jgi:hypothetical protein
MPYTLFMRQSFPFAQNPGFAELEGEKILLNNVILPRTIDQENAFNPHSVGLWVIGHEFGALCAVWASNEQDALDEACDAGMLECFQVSESDVQAYRAEHGEDDPEWNGLGNASEPHDLTLAWCAPVEFDAARDIALIVAIVRRSEQTEDTL